MRVRSTTPADAVGIARVHVETWRVAYRGHMPDAVLDELSVVRRTVFWERRLAPASGGIFVAHEGGEILGFCDVIPSRDSDARAGVVAEIGAIYVHPGYWRHGAGRMLCHAALNEARRRHYEAVTLWVLEANAPARKFYEAMGFKPDGALKTDFVTYGTELHEVRYRMVV